MLYQTATIGAIFSKVYTLGACAIEGQILASIRVMHACDVDLLHLFSNTITMHLMYSLSCTTFATCVHQISNTMREGNIVIRVKDNETIDRALKRFKKKFEKVGVLKKLRKRMFHKKPSIEHREQRLKAIYRQKMQAKAAV